MEQYFGKAVFHGIAIGRIVEAKQPDKAVRRERVSDIEEEVKRFIASKQKSFEQLTKLHDKAVKEVGEANAAIFEVHQMMLADEDYNDSILNIIRTQAINAEYAVAVTGDNFFQMFEAMEDEYMKERAADIKDISERLIHNLGHFEAAGLVLAEPSIVVADDLSPSETVQLDKEKVLAFATRKGSINSHTAILARTMNIPAIVCVPIPDNVHGKTAVVNGFEGVFVVDPDTEVLKKAKRLKSESLEKSKLLLEYKGKATVTKSGRKIKLYANIGGVGDIGAVLQNDAAGIGLFRSEFLYLQDSDYPSEEKQFLTYKQVAEMMAGKKVIIRTLDIGADKQIDYFKLEKEENPALGYRAIRICLTREDIFKTQLRALYRASAYGNIAIMVPMIISLWEVKRVKELISDIKIELEQADMPYKNVEFGIMIETPAAVMVADDLAKEVDFFSIGTNDLTQYTLAIDRQIQSLDKFYDAYHPAVLKLIKMTIESAHSAGIWIGICGELGADISMTEEFIKMGIDELSVSPAMVLPIRKKISEIE